MDKQQKQLVSMEVGADGVAIITLSNPPVNALSLPVIKELKLKYNEGMKRADVKAMVLTGAGGKFCSGLDITIMLNVQKQGDISVLPDLSIDLLVKKLEGGKKPCVAALQGFAFGGGLELAMGCNARIAAPRTQLGLPELSLGVIPGAGGTQRLPRLVGVRKAVEMLLTSKSILSEEAKELGLVDAIASSQELLNVARAWALHIAEGSRPHCNSLQRTDKIGPIQEALEILEAARQMTKHRFPHMHQHIACLDVIQKGIVSGGYAGVLKEDKVFKELVLSNIAKSLIHVFLSEREIKKLPGVTDAGHKPRKITKVAVIGGGLMGSGIATALVLSNINVVLKEINQHLLQKGKKSIEANLQGLMKKGELQQDRMKKALSLLNGVVDYEELRHVDMIIETVNEDVSLKQSIFEDMENVCPPHCILASNTSTIDLGVLGKRTRSQDRIIGAHFFSPAHVMPLLEIVQTKETSAQVVLDLLTVAKNLKKVPVVVQNCTGFAVNRTFFPYMQAADLLVNLGVDIFRIDTVISAFGMPMGPFQLMDVSGYEVFKASVKQFASVFPDRTFHSPLVDLIEKSNRKGKKNGRGYYTYEKGSKPRPDHSVLLLTEESRKLTNIIPGGKPIIVSDQEIVEMIFFPVVNEACRVIEEGVVVRASDLDIASIHGMKFPSYHGGIVFWADRVGPKYIYTSLKKWCETYGNFYKPSKFLEESAIKGLPLARNQQTTLSSL